MCVYNVMCVRYVMNGCNVVYEGLVVYVYEFRLVRMCCYVCVSAM